MKLYIATGNKGKYQSAQEYLSNFNIETEQVKLNLLELQGENIESIVIHKAEQAFDQLKKPVVITDVGWQIPALKGFPGPYMHSILEWFELEDLLALMKSKKDRTILIENIAVYKDSKTTKTFHRYLTGQILETPKGEGNIIDQLCTFRKDKLTSAECDALGLPMSDDPREKAKSQWIKLGEWLSLEKK